MAPRERWRLLTTWDEDARFHMGFDEAQLEAGCTPPTLRLYTWSPDALSLGYFQRLADVRERDRATEIVRRMTGGGAIHHVEELTFSITVPVGHALYRGPVGESYRRVHGAVATALAAAGIEAQLREERSAGSDRPGTGMCFHASTPPRPRLGRAQGRRLRPAAQGAGHPPPRIDQARPLGARDGRRDRQRGRAAVGGTRVRPAARPGLRERARARARRRKRDRTGEGRRARARRTLRLARDAGAALTGARDERR